MAIPSTEDEKGALGILGETIASAGSSVLDFGSSAIDTVVETVANPLDSLQSFGETISDTSANLIKNTGSLLYNTPGVIADTKQDIQQSVTDWYTGTTNKPNDTIESLEKYKDDFKREKSYFAEGWKDVKELGAGLLFQVNLGERLFGREDEQNLKETVDTKDYNQKITIFEKGIGEEQSKFASLESDPRIERANNFYRNAQRNFELLNGKSAEKDPTGFQEYIASKFQELPAFEQQQVVSQQTLKEQLAKEYQAGLDQKQAELSTYLNDQSVDGKGADRYKEWKTEQENELKDNDTFKKMGKIRSEVETEVDEAITKLNIEKLGSYSGFNNLREQMIDDAATYRQQELDIYYGDLPNAKEFARKAMELNDVKRKTDLKYLETFIKEKNDIENKSLTDLEISKKTATKTWNSLSADEQKKFADMETFITTLTTIQKSKDLASRGNFDPRQVLDIASLWGNTVGTVSDKAFAELEGVPHYFNQETRNLVYANEGNLNKAISVLTYNPDVIGSMFLSTLGVAGAGKVVSKFSKTLGTASEAAIAKIPFKIGSTPGTLTFLGRNAKALTASQIYGAATDPILDNAMVQTTGPVNDAFNQITNIFFDMAVPATSMLTSTSSAASVMGGKYIANNISYQFLNGDKKKAVQDMTEYLNKIQGIKTTPVKVNEMMKAVVEDMYPLMFNPKEFDEMVNSQGGLYNFVSTSIKDMDQSNVGEMLTAKGIAFKKIIPEILGVPKSVVTNFNEALTVLGKKTTDTKELVAKQFAAKKIVSELDTIKDAFETGSSNGYRGVTLDKKKILTPEAQTEYSRLKTQGLNLINEIQSSINTTEVKSIDMQSKFKELQQTIIDTQRKFGFNKKGVNQIEMILPAGNISNPSGSFLIDIDKLEELQAGSFDELIKNGAITIKSDQVIDGKKFKKGNKIFMANQGHEGVLNGIAKYIKYDESIDNLADRIYEKISTLLPDASPKFIEKNLKDGFFNVVKGAGGTLSMSILKDPLISKNEELISEIMDDIATTFNSSLNNYFKKVSGIDNALASKPLKVNDIVANKETYYAKGEEIMDLMTSVDNYFAISYGYFKDMRTYSKDGFGNAIYLSLGNKTINKLGKESSIVESFLNAHRDDSANATMRRINNNASQLKQMIFDFGFKDGKLDIEKGVSKATQVAAATDNSSLFTNGVFDKDKVRSFVTNNLDLKTKEQEKTTQEIVDFMTELFDGIDSGYEAISVPIGLSVLYHYSKNKKLIDAAMQKLDNPDFKKLMSDILLAPDVAEQIAKQMKDSSKIDVKYKEAPSHLKRQVEKEFANYRQKLVYKKELFETESKEIKSYLKGMGSSLSDLQKNKLNARLIEIDTKIKNVQAQLSKKVGPIISDTVELYNIDFLKRMSENFIETKRIIESYPEDKERWISLINKKIETLKGSIEEKGKVLAKIRNLDNEEIKEITEVLSIVSQNKTTSVVDELAKRNLSTEQEELIFTLNDVFQSKNTPTFSLSEQIEIFEELNKVDDVDITTRSEKLVTTENPYINYMSSFITGNTKYFNEGLAASFNNYFTGKTAQTTGPELYNTSETFKMFTDSFRPSTINKKGEVLFKVPNGDLSKPETWKGYKEVGADAQKNFMKYILRNILTNDIGPKIFTEKGDETLLAIDNIMNMPALYHRFRKTIASTSLYQPSSDIESQALLDITDKGLKINTIDPSQGFIESVIKIQEMQKAGMDINILREFEFERLPYPEEDNKYRYVTWVNSTGPSKIKSLKEQAIALKSAEQKKFGQIRFKYNEFKKTGKNPLTATDQKIYLEYLKKTVETPTNATEYFAKMFNGPRVKDLDKTTDPKFIEDKTLQNSTRKQRAFLGAIDDGSEDGGYLINLWKNNYTFVGGFGDKITGQQFYKAPKEIIDKLSIKSIEDLHAIQKELYLIEYAYVNALTQPEIEFKTFADFKKGLFNFAGDNQISIDLLKDFIYKKEIKENKVVIKNKYALSIQDIKKREASQMSNIRDFGDIIEDISIYIIEKNNPAVEYYEKYSPNLLDKVLFYHNSLDEVKKINKEDLAGMERSKIAKLITDYVDATETKIIDGKEVETLLHYDAINEYFKSNNDAFAREYKDRYFTIGDNFSKSDYYFNFDRASELISTFLTNDRDDGLSFVTDDLIIKRLQAQGFSKKEAEEYVKDGTFKEFKSHGIHDGDFNGQKLRFQAKTLFVSAGKSTMNKGGKDIELDKNSVFVGANSAKIKSAIVPLSDKDPKYITRNGIQYKITGKVENATTDFFRNAATDVVDHGEEVTFSSSILASLSAGANLRITEMMTTHIATLFEKYLREFLTGDFKPEAFSDIDKMLNAYLAKTKLGYGSSATINKAVARFLDDVNYYIKKPKQAGEGSFLVGATDNIKPNEIIFHEKSNLVQETRSEVTKKLFGKDDYNKLSDGEKAIVDKNLITVGYRYPVSSKYSSGVFKIKLNTDKSFNGEFENIGKNHVVLSTETMYITFKGDSDGDHSFFISGTGEWGDIAARDILGDSVTKKAPSLLELYGDFENKEGIETKIKSANRMFDNYVTIAKEIKKATDIKTETPTIEQTRLGSYGAKKTVGPGTALARTLKLIKLHKDLAELIDDPDWADIIKSIYGENITKEDLLNQKIVSDGMVNIKDHDKTTIIAVNKRQEFTIKYILEKFPYLSSGKGFVEGIGTLLNALVDAGSSGDVRINPEWFVEFIGEAKFGKQDGFTTLEKIEIYEDFGNLLKVISMNNKKYELDISSVKEIAGKTQFKPVKRNGEPIDDGFEGFDQIDPNMYMPDEGFDEFDQFDISDADIPVNKIDKPKKTVEQVDMWNEEKIITNGLNATLGNRNFIFQWFKNSKLAHYISRITSVNEDFIIIKNVYNRINENNPDLDIRKIYKTNNFKTPMSKKEFDEEFFDIKKSESKRQEIFDTLVDEIPNSESKQKFLEASTFERKEGIRVFLGKYGPLKTREIRKAIWSIREEHGNNAADLAILAMYTTGESRLMKYVSAEDWINTLEQADRKLKGSLETMAEETGMNVFDELDLDEIFKNSSEEAKLKAKQNLPDDIEPTKENISIQIKKEELIKEEEKNIQQQIKSKTDTTELEFELAELQRQLGELELKLENAKNKTSNEITLPSITSTEVIGGVKTDMFSLPDVDYKLVDEDVTKALNILSMYDDVEFRHNKNVGLRTSTTMENFFPDVASNHSFLASFMNQGDIVPNAMAVYINHFGKKLITNGDGLKSVIMDSVENPKLQQQIIKSVLKNTFEFDTVAKEFRVKSRDEMISFMNLEERKFNMENIEKLNDKLDEYIKDIADPLLKKINFLQSQGIDIKTGYKNTMETLVPDFLEAHKSDAQIAFKTLGFHNEEQIFDRFKQVLKQDKLNPNQRVAARIVVELFLRKQGDTSTEVIKSILSMAKLQHYSMTYGPLSWITLNGIGAAVSQMPPNFMEVIAYRRGHDLKNAKRIAEDYNLLASESSIKFGSGYANELNSNSLLDDAFQGLSNTLSSAVNGSKAPSMPMRLIHATLTNPMGATDALIEGTRKQVAIQSAMDRFGIKDAADFDRKVKQHGREFLANFENQARINYADSGGGVISSSQLYRETIFNHLDKYFIKENGTPIPVVYHIAKIITGGLGYLSGWAYHKTATLLEHSGALIKYAGYDWYKYGLKDATANVKDSIIYFDSQIRLVGTTVGLFLKINKYENDDSNIASFDDFMKAVNNTFVALDMMFGGRLERNILLADKDAGFSKSLGYNVYQEYLNIGRLFKQKKFLDDVWTHYQATESSKKDIFNSFQFGMQVHYSGFIRGVGAERTNDEYEIAASNNRSALLLVGSTTAEEKILSDIVTQKGLATYGELGFLGSIQRNLLGNPIPYAVLLETRKELMKAMIDDKDIGKLYKGGQLGTGANDYNISLLYGAEGSKLTAEQAERLKDAWYRIEASTLLQADDLGEKDQGKNRTAEQDKYRSIVEKALAKEGKSLDYFVEAYSNPRVDFKPLIRELSSIETKYGIPQANITAMIILQDYKNAQSTASKIIQEKTGSFRLTDREALELKRDVLLRNQVKLNGDFSFVELVGNQHAVMKHKDILDRMTPLVETSYNMDWEYQKVAKGLATMNRISQTIKKDTSVAKLNTPYALALSGIKDTQEGVDIVNTAIFKIYRTPSLTNKEKLANVAALVHGLSKKTFAIAKENDNFMTITEDSRKLLANTLYSTLSSAEQYDTNSNSNSFNRYSSGGYTQKYRGSARDGARPNFSKQFEPVKKMLEPLIQYVDKNPDKYVADRNPYKDDNYINPLQFPYVREQYRLRIQTIYDGYLSKGIIKQRTQEKEVDSFKKETINLKRVKKVKEYKPKKQNTRTIKKHLKGLNPNLELGYSTEK